MPQGDHVPTKRPGSISRLLSSLRASLSKFFARKSPIGFDVETGSWTDPDVFLSRSPNADAPPRPLVNNDCKRSHIVYSVALNVVPVCNFAARQQALSEAIDEAVDYFDNHFRCENPHCIQKAGAIIWTGVSCHQNPTSATGAVLVRFSCEIQL